jgi:hypothetical protein
MSRTFGVRPRRRHVREGAFGVPQIVEDDLSDAGDVRFGDRCVQWIHADARKTISHSMVSMTSRVRLGCAKTVQRRAPASPPTAGSFRPESPPQEPVWRRGRSAVGSGGPMAIRRFKYPPHPRDPGQGEPDALRGRAHDRPVRPVACCPSASADPTRRTEVDARRRARVPARRHRLFPHRTAPP